MSIIKKNGSECLESVKAAADSLSKRDTTLATKHLAKVEVLLPSILNQIQSFIDKCKLGQSRLESEEKDQQKQLEAQKRNLENQIRSKNNEINSLESDRHTAEDELSNARNSLSITKENLERARRKKDKAENGTIAAGVGAGILGILYPPSLFVTAALMQGLIASVSDCYNAVIRYDNKCDSLKGNILIIQKEINSLRNSIRSQERNRNCINNNIHNYNQEIKDLQREQQSLQERKRENFKTVTFLYEAQAYFKNLKQVTQYTPENTQNIHSQISKLFTRAVKLIFKQRNNLSKKKEMLKKFNMGQRLLNSWKEFERQLETGHAKQLFGIEIYDF